MIDRGANPSEDESLSPVQRLLMEVLAEGGEEPAAALELRCRAHPEHASELRRRVRWLESTGLLQTSRASAAQAVPERLGDFRLLERLGGGGMGIVYRAHQESLGREVALKLVRPEQLFFTDARERFRREVSSVASLNHPGIVPVYSVGEEGGIPYFAMELVRGATLADVLEVLDARDPATLSGRELERAIAAAAGEGHSGEGAAAQPAPLFAGTWEEAGLRIVREVAEALEHAHRAGLVHRDVKPSNVMVTRGGRVMLVDFGLSSDARTERLTRTGSQVGSLPYMPPEQLTGERPADRRSDVYSLGVTLYELLALRLPYAESNAAALARRVLEGRPPLLRRRNARVSWEAETVCFKALESEPERRYASAGDFARDLTNVLERRPVFARRASWLRRAQRWSQRNPGAAAALVLGLLLFGVAPAAWAWRERATSRRLGAQSEALQGANLSLQDSLAATRSEWERAEANYEDALAAVDRMLTRLADDRLQHLPHLELLRREVYEDALSFYERLAARRADDPALRHELARARIRMAHLLQLLGRTAELDATIGEAITILEQLARESPGDELLQSELGRAFVHLSTVNDNLGRRVEHEEAAGRALAIFRELGARRPEALAQREGLARALKSLARAQLMTGRLDDAAAALQEAVDAFGGEAAEASAEASLLLADLLQDQGGVLLASGRAAEARDALLQAHARAGRWAERFSEHPDFRKLEMDLLHRLANVALARGEKEEALEHWSRQIEVTEGLVRDFPGAHIYQCHQVQAVANRGAALMHLERHAEAADAFRRAIALGEEMVAALPAEPHHHFQLATTRKNLAEVLVRDRRFAEASALLDLAVPALDAYAAAAPGDRDALVTCGAAHFCRAEVHVGLESHAEAATELRSMRRLQTNPVLRFNAVILFARCARLAGEDEALEPSACAALAEEYEREMLDTLSWAIAGGFRDRAWLERTSELDRFREWPEFQEIVEPLR